MLQRSCQLRLGWKLGIALAFGISGAMFVKCDRTIAEIVGDTTLGTESTVVTPNGITFQIDGGATRGTNLFHSFREFSVPTNGTAFFNNSSTIQNIIGRVIGPASTIDGTLKAIGTANLFLINPNGISFGPNATLNLGGSFVASTASSISFADGTQFSATTPQATPLLTVTVPLGLQYGTNSGDISVTGASLTVQPDKTLALVGGNVSLNGGILQAPSGRIELGGLAGTGTVELKGTDSNLRLKFPDGVGQANISVINSQLSTDSSSATGATAGSILLTGGTISIVNSEITSLSNNDKTSDFGLIQLTATQGAVLLNQSKLSATNFGSGFAGDISITARDQVSINQSNIFSRGNFGRIFIGESDDYASFSPRRITIDNSKVTTTNDIDSTVGGNINAGNISLQANDSISFTNKTELSSSTSRAGKAGNVTLAAGGAITFDNSNIFSNVESGGLGNAGQIKVEAESLSVLNGSQLQSGVVGPKNGKSAGEGNGGNVTINVRDRVTIGGLNSDNFPGAIFTDVEKGARGNAGNITITAKSVEIFNRGRLISSISGTGEAGNIRVIATDSVSITGNGTLSPCSTGICSTINNGAVVPASSGNTFAGNAFAILAGASNTDLVGSVVIITGTLSLADGAVVNVSTYGQGNAGAVVVFADGKVSLTNNSAIGSLVGTTGVGSAGGVVIIADSLSIADSSGVTTSTVGQGDAGLILVVTDRDVTVKGNGSGIVSTIEEEATGNSGGILIQARDLFIRDGAEISVNNNDLSFGTAGDIVINVRDLRLENGGSLTAITKSGDGGNMSLTVRDFLVLTRGSNISTTAGTINAGGDGGNIKINNQRPRARSIWGLPVNDSNITAQAFTGSGGSILVNAGRLYRIDRRSNDFLNTNDITVSSTYGREGQIEINSIDIDPTQGLINLPETPIDPSRLIAQTCPARAGGSATEVNKFTVPGTGGLPPNPNETLQNNSVETDFITPNLPRENRKGNDSSSNPSRPASSERPVQKTAPLVEAQGWVYGANGEVILTAQANTATPQSPSLTPVAASCNAY